MSIMRSAVLATALLAMPLAAAAEVLVIEHTQQTAGQNKPANGLSMADVEARYGIALEKRDAIGDPPITQWVYDGFVVYFEYDRVIHAVTQRANSE